MVKWMQMVPNWVVWEVVCVISRVDGFPNSINSHDQTILSSYENTRAHTRTHTHARTHAHMHMLHTMYIFSPHLCVGFLFLILYPAPPPPPPAPPPPPLCHTQLFHTPSFTQLCHTHTTLSHTTMSRTTLSHTSLSHNFVTHNFVTHHLSQTTLSHTTLSHATLQHTPALLPPTIFNTQLCHKQLCHTHTHPHTHTPTIFHSQFAWQAWHLATSTFVLRGRRGTCGTGLGLVVRLVAVSRPWRRGTLRGRRGTCWHRRLFCVPRLPWSCRSRLQPRGPRRSLWQCKHD